MFRFFLLSFAALVFTQKTIFALEDFKSIPQGPGKYQIPSVPSGRGARWGYPQDFIDGPYLESDYQITGVSGPFYDDMYTFTVYRPSFFSFRYPFNVPDGWKVVDPVKLGVTPPPLPNYLEKIKYKGYWYGCPTDLDLYNASHWLFDENRFTNFCQYFYYY